MARHFITWAEEGTGGVVVVEEDGSADGVAAVVPPPPSVGRRREKKAAEGRGRSKARLLLPADDGEGECGGAPPLCGTDSAAVDAAAGGVDKVSAAAAGAEQVEVGVAGAAEAVSPDGVGAGEPTSTTSSSFLISMVGGAFRLLASFFST